jgi:integrase
MNTMATIRKEPNGRKTILVVCGDEKRRSIRLGKCSMKDAQSAKTHIERLNTAKILNTSIDNEQALWLSGLGDLIHKRISATGLCPPRVEQDATTLIQWCDRYLDSAQIKESTKEQIERARDNLVAYFGADRLIREITTQQAKEWVAWLAKNGNERAAGKDKSLALNTVRRRTGRAKQFFTAAVEAKLITDNPFESKEIVCATGDNRERMSFIDAATIEKCIAVTAGDWRTIIALARYGGLRIPSELVKLRWADINWAELSMTIHAPKTEHHKGGGVRQMPILPDLAAHLRDAFESAPDGAEFVIRDASKRAMRVNLATEFKRIIKRAGVVAWPKLWQNLRASRETELMAQYPLKDVCGWIGNSPEVALQHYAMAQSEHFQRAIAEGIGGKSGSKPVKKAAQKQAQ